jgi:3-dehydroquinate synthase
LLLKEIKMEASNGSSRILLGESVKNLSNYIKAKKSVIITDNNVRQFHGHLFPESEIIEIGTGEQIKNLSTINKILQRFLELELDRSSLIIGIGGGIVCDITGFAASTYMRGLQFAFVPSTLLAQVDAAIGGKSEKELVCGIAEVVKHALIKSTSLFDLLEEEWNSLLSLKPNTTGKIIEESVKIKADIVSADPLEAGERRKLNFGHTLGHAIEKTLHLPHGEAVSIGMVAAARISEARGTLSLYDTRRIESLLQNFRLPFKLPADSEPLIEAIKKDKKRTGEEIYFVLLAGIGKAEVKKISYKELGEYIHDLCKHR